MRLFLLAVAALACGLVLLSSETMSAQPLAGKRILYIDSYHQGYDWSDGILQGIRQALEGTGIVLEIFHMDTKRLNSEPEKENAGAAALEVVRSFKPDLVIASDDNAQRYLVVPHLLDSGIPVVFCGVNWSADEYGYPTETITGMIEMESVETLISHLERFAQGNRIGFLSEDTLSEHKTSSIYNELFFNGSMQTWFYSSFEEFKTTFLEAQARSDMLLLSNNASLTDWDDRSAARFLAENIHVPTGSINRHMAPFVIYTMVKLPEEHGQWAAETAMRILSGVSPRDIPLVRNEQGGLIVNLVMADALGVVVPVKTLRAADQVVNSDDPLFQEVRP